MITTFQIVQAGLFVLAAIVAAIVTPVCIKAARKWNVLDYPSWRKVHKKPIPYLGGTALFVSFWLIAGAIFLTAHIYLKSDGGKALAFLAPFRGLFEGGLNTLPQMILIFSGSLVIYLVGLCDDIKHLGPLPKFIAQCVAAGFLVSCGYKISAFGLPPIFGYLFAFIWILILINAFNFIDSLDGHLVGVSLVAGIFFFAVTQLLGQPLVSLILLILIGALIGFLPYNFHPARIFLGDAGSTFLGYMFAAITLICTYRQPEANAFTFLFPVCIFSVPLYDMMSVILIRLFTRKPIYIGDRNHLAHRLVELGMSERVSVMFSFLVTFACGLIALLLYTVDVVGVVLIMLIYACILSIVAFLELYVTRRLRIEVELREKHLRRKEDFLQEEERRIK